MIAAALERDEAVPESLIPPVLGEIEAAFWDGFTGLRAASPSLTPAPIPIAEILAWCDLAGIDDPASRREFHDVIRALDQAWLAAAQDAVSQSPTV